MGRRPRQSLPPQRATGIFYKDVLAFRGRETNGCLIIGPLLKARLRDAAVTAMPDAEFPDKAHPKGRNSSAELRARADRLHQTFGDPPFGIRPSLDNKRF